VISGAEISAAGPREFGKKRKVESVKLKVVRTSRPWGLVEFGKKCKVESVKLKVVRTSRPWGLVEVEKMYKAF